MVQESESPVETLRRAAGRLDTLVTGATPGPWATGKGILDDYPIYARGSEIAVAYTPADADLIAALRPLAIHLAALLRVEATVAEQAGSEPVTPALYAAREILGEVAR